MIGYQFKGTDSANREEWLQRVADLLTAETDEILEARGNGLSELRCPKVRISCAFPVGTRGGSHGHAIGQCWHGMVSGDGTFEIFISPEISEPKRAADILAHELVHAIDRLENGHRGRFKEIAKAIGLDGPMTATHAGDELSEWLSYLTARVGPYPHASMAPWARKRQAPPEGSPKGTPPIITDAPPKQSTRMLKVECPSCGCVARMSKRWLDVGAPWCGNPDCSAQMEAK